MTITQLIKVLEEVRGEFGDLEVKVSDDQGPRSVNPFDMDGYDIRRDSLVL